MRSSKLFIPVSLCVIAIINSGCGVISEMLATETPLPTNTPLPTATPTNTPTPLPTATPEPTSTPAPVTSQEEQSDGSIVYSDLENGYKITFPPDWFVLDLSEGDFQEILEAGLDIFSDLDEDITAFIEGSAADNFRAMVVDVNEDHLSESGFANISILVVEDPTAAALPLDFFLEFYAQSLPSLLPEAEVLNSELIENSSGLSLGIIEIEISVENLPGISFKQTQVIFKAESGLVIIVFTSPDDLLELMTPIFEEIYNSIALLD